METYIKKDANLLDKMRRKKMNDFSKIRKGSVHNAYVRKNLGPSLIILFLNFPKNQKLIYQKSLNL